MFVTDYDLQCFFFFFVLHTFCLCLFVWTKLIKMTKKQTGNKAIYSILSEDLITNFSLSYFCFVLFGPKNSQYLRERLLVFRRQINPGFLTFELCGYKNILIDSVEDEIEYCVRHKNLWTPKFLDFSLRYGSFLETHLRSWPFFCHSNFWIYYSRNQKYCRKYLRTSNIHNFVEIVEGFLWRFQFSPTKRSR